MQGGNPLKAGRLLKNPFDQSPCGPDGLPKSGALELDGVEVAAIIVFGYNGIVYL